MQLTFKWEYCSMSLRSKYLHKLFGIFLHGIFVSSLPFIYLFNNLFISGRAHEYLYILCYNPMSFVILSVSAWPLGALLVDSCVSLTNSIIIGFVGGGDSSGSFSSLLLYDTTRCCRLILHISFPSPKINHFSKEP